LTDEVIVKMRANKATSAIELFSNATTVDLSDVCGKHCVRWGQVWLYSTLGSRA